MIRIHHQKEHRSLKGQQTEIDRRHYLEYYEGRQHFRLIEASIPKIRLSGPDIEVIRAYTPYKKIWHKQRIKLDPISLAKVRDEGVNVPSDFVVLQRKRAFGSRKK